MTLPRLSVITLTKNRAGMLKKHLDSLIGQTKSGDEIVIVDNGSTDNTFDVIKSFEKRLPIRLFTSRALGFPKLYNFAIKKAKNPIIVSFDDDCIAASHFLSRHRAAHTDGNLRVVQGAAKSIPKGNIYADIMGDHYRNWFLMYMTKNNSMRTFDNKNVSFQKSLIVEYGQYATYLGWGGDDIELGLRYHRLGVPIEFHPDILVYHRERTTFTGFVQQHLRFARSDARLARYLKEEKSLSVFVWYKIWLHTRSAVRREGLYLRTGQLTNAVTLPFLYLTLFFLRIWGYATSR